MRQRIIRVTDRFTDSMFDVSTDCSSVRGAGCTSIWFPWILDFFSAGPATRDSIQCSQPPLMPIFDSCRYRLGFHKIGFELFLFSLLDSPDAALLLLMVGFLGALS